MILMMFLLLFNAVFCYSLYITIKSLRRMTSTAIMSINQLQTGFVSTQGIISNKTTPLLKSPLTGKECYWYKFEIEEFKTIRNNDNSEETKWCAIRQGESKDFFIIEDATGECVVSPDFAEVFPQQTDTWQSNTLPIIELSEVEKMKLSLIPQSMRASCPNPVTGEEPRDPSIKEQIKSQATPWVIGNLLGMSTPLTIKLPGLRKKADKLYRFRESRLSANEKITVLGQYQRLDKNDIEKMIQEQEQKEKNYAFMQKAIDTLPTFRKRFLYLLDYMTRTNTNTVGIISNIIRLNPATIISAIPQKKLIRKYIIRIVIFSALILLFSSMMTFFAIHGVPKSDSKTTNQSSFAVEFHQS